MNKGDIVLIKFPFTDFSEAKLRLFLILGKNQEDFLVSFISSIKKRILKNELFLKKDNKDNLKVDSTIKFFKSYTVHSQLIERQIGKIEKEFYKKVTGRIKKLITD